MTKYIILGSIIFVGALWSVFNLLGRRYVAELQKEPRDIDVQTSSKLDGGEVTLGAQFVIPEDKYITVTSADGSPLFKIQKTQNQALLGYIRDIYDFRDAGEKISGRKSLKSMYTGYDIQSLVESASETDSKSIADVGVLESFYTKNTVALQSSGTGDLPIMTVFYVDGKAYALYSAPEGPRGEKIESGKIVIVDYTKEISERLGVPVSEVQKVAVEWSADLYRRTSKLQPPEYYVSKMYFSTTEKVIKVTLHAYMKGVNTYELQIDPQTLKVVDVVVTE